MRKIVAGLWMSLDGVVESPEKWVFPYFDDEVRQVIWSGLAAADTMLLGRRTYEGFAAYWPGKTVADDPLADHMNNIPKLVASTTLRTVEWQHSTLIKGNVAAELRRLKQQPGKDTLITGSATLVRSLLRDGLLDQLRLMLFPIVLGSGKRLFEDGGEQVALKLVEAKTFSTGAVSATYGPAGR